MFERYSPYRSRDMDENLICSPRKVSFTIQSTTEKFLIYAPSRSRDMAENLISSTRKCPSIYTEKERNLFEICTLKKPRYGAKTDFLPKKNALHYTQCNNETFQWNAHYRSRNMEENLICSPRKMPFTILRVITKHFIDMPLIEDAIWGNILFALQEKCPSP